MNESSQLSPFAARPEQRVATGHKPLPINTLLHNRRSYFAWLLIGNQVEKRKDPLTLLRRINRNLTIRPNRSGLQVPLDSGQPFHDIDFQTRGLRIRVLVLRAFTRCGLFRLQIPQLGFDLSV